MACTSSGVTPAAIGCRSRPSPLPPRCHLARRSYGQDWHQRLSGRASRRTSCRNRARNCKAAGCSARQARRAPGRAGCYSPSPGEGGHSGVNVDPGLQSRHAISALLRVDRHQRCGVIPFAQHRPAKGDDRDCTDCHNPPNTRQDSSLNRPRWRPLRGGRRKGKRAWSRHGEFLRNYEQKKPSL